MHRRSGRATGGTIERADLCTVGVRADGPSTDRSPRSRASWSGYKVRRELGGEVPNRTRQSDHSGEGRRELAGSASAVRIERNDGPGEASSLGGEMIGSVSHARRAPPAQKTLSDVNRRGWLRNSGTPTVSVDGPWDSGTTPSAEVGSYGPHSLTSFRPVLRSATSR
jgi:hypothetical protein